MEAQLHRSRCSRPANGPMASDDRGERCGGRPVVGLDPHCLLAPRQPRLPRALATVRDQDRRDKGAAFSRACASVTGPPSRRRPITHSRRARTTTSITINPATNSSTATIGHIFPYQSGCCVGEIGVERHDQQPCRSTAGRAPQPPFPASLTGAGALASRDLREAGLQARRCELPRHRSSRL